jgi:uncharacterized membrane protein YbhN (UPF0104 family)
VPRERRCIFCRMRSGSVWLHRLSILLGVAIIVFVGSRIGIADALEQAGRLSPLVLLPLVAVYSVSWLMRGLRLKLLANDLGGKPGFPLALGTELVADLANQVIPARMGDVAKVALLKRRGVLDVVPGAFAAFMVRFGDLAAVTLLMLGCVPFLPGEETSGFTLYMSAAGGLVLLSAVAVFLFAVRPRTFARVVPARMPGLRRQVLRLGRHLKGHPSGALRLLGVSALVWIFDILTLYVLLEAFHVRLAPAATGFVLLASNLTKAFPITPNGLGVYEGAMVLLLGAFGVPESTAFAVAVLDHAFMNAMSFVMGAVALGMLGLRPGRLRDLIGRGSP